MKVAIWYDNRYGRNDGPPLYYWNVLKNQLKLDVYHLIPIGTDFSRFGKMDLHFWVDWGEDGLPYDRSWEIPKDGGKTIYVCSDAHIDKLGKEYRFNMASKFDYAFFNQKQAMQEFAQWIKFKSIDKLKIKDWHFLPHAADPKAYPHFEILKKYDVSFIGHIQDIVNYNGFTRIDMLDRVFKEFPNFFFGTRTPIDPAKNMFEDASKRFCESRIVLNVSIKDDLNMRLFEILSSGSFQLTNWLPTLEDIGLKDGIHLATYKTLDEMVEKIKYYLGHEEEREKIAQTGHEEFMKKHTYQHRIETIFKIIGVKLSKEGDKNGQPL